MEQMLVQIRNAVDNNGKRIRLTPKKIVSGPSNVFQAEVLLKSALRAGTANNDINPVKSMGLLADGQLVEPRRTWPPRAPQTITLPAPGRLVTGVPVTLQSFDVE